MSSKKQFLTFIKKDESIITDDGNQKLKRSSRTIKKRDFNFWVITSVKFSNEINFLFDNCFYFELKKIYFENRINIEINLLNKKLSKITSK